MVYLWNFNDGETMIWGDTQEEAQDTYNELFGDYTKVEQVDLDTPIFYVVDKQTEEGDWTLDDTVFKAGMENDESVVKIATTVGELGNNLTTA